MKRKALMVLFVTVCVLAYRAAAQDNTPSTENDIPTRFADDILEKSGDVNKVMVVWDVTESMKWCYDTTVIWAMKILQRLSSQGNFSAGFVTFSDNSPRRKTVYNDYLWPLTISSLENRKEFQFRLPLLKDLVSGGDPPEDSLTALYNAVGYMRKLNDSDPEPMRFIILFTDNPYHTPKMPGDAGSIGICYDQLMKILLDGKIVVYAVTVDFEKLRNKLIKNVDMKKIADKSYKAMAERTGGLWFELKVPRRTRR